MNFKSITIFSLFIIFFACQEADNEIIHEYPTALLNSVSFLDLANTAHDRDKLSASLK